MSVIRVCSSRDLAAISAKARAQGGRALPEGADAELSEGAAHILARTDQEPRRSVNALGVVWRSVRVRASVALKGEAYPAECYLDVEAGMWDQLTNASTAMELLRLNPKWKVPDFVLDGKGQAPNPLG